MLELLFGPYDRADTARQLDILKSVRGFSIAGSLGRAAALGAYIGGLYPVFKPGRGYGGGLRLRDFDFVCPTDGLPIDLPDEAESPHKLDPSVHILLSHVAHPGRLNPDDEHRAIPGFPVEAARIFMRPTTCGLQVPTLSLGTLAAIEAAMPARDSVYTARKVDFINQVRDMRVSGKVPPDEFLSDRATEQIVALSWDNWGPESYG